jgi:GNAT superfamily N-acetyltransferase
MKLKCEWEPLSVLLDDGLPELVRLHHQEVGVHKEQMSLDCDWAGYQEDEDAGKLRLLGGRIDGILVGYHSLFILKGHRHYNSTPHAMSDAIYVMAEHRRSGLGIELIDKTERDILAEFAPRWVRFWYHDKAGLRFLGPVLQKRGYGLIEECWDKIARA